MKPIAVKLSGMPFDPGSSSGFIEDGETETVIALESSCTGPCKRHPSQMTTHQPPRFSIDPLTGR